MKEESVLNKRDMREWRKGLSRATGIAFPVEQLLASQKDCSI